MFERLRPHILRFMRVPHDPDPPFGAPGSARIFRAGVRFYHLRLVRWAFTQVGAVIGIGFSVYFISMFEREYDEAQQRVTARTQAAAVAAAQPAAAPVTTAAPTSTVPAPAEAAPEKAETKKERNARRRANREQQFDRVLERLPWWVPILVRVGEFFAIAGFLVSLPFTFAAARLDWELRWYIVTDRSLRIRAGLVSLQESTMSFANLQQVEVRQGPLQRLLGIADLRVQSAGGGGGKMKGHQMEDSLHTGVFHGVDNAHEIRDLILDRLKTFRAAGLGDPEDHSAEAVPAVEAIASTSTTETASSPANDALGAARELLEEARALRRALT